MRKSVHFLLPGALAWACFVCPAAGQEAEPRSYTNRDGKVIEAVLLDVAGQNARIRRVADNRVFEIPVGTLSLDDQIWIVDWIRRKARPAAGEWANLRVVLPNPMDSCAVVGLASSCLPEKIGASEFDLLLPEGAWVKVSVYSTGDTPQPLEHLIPFRGSMRWEFSVDGSALFLSRDGEQPMIVGITVPSTVTEEWLDDIEENRLADWISVEVSPSIDFQRIEWRKTEIVACISKYPADEEFLGKIAAADPRAVDLTVSSDAIDRLSGFSGLEAMAMRVSLRNRAADGTRTRDAVDDLVLDKLPAVRDLSLHGIPFSQNLGAALCESGKLRMFDFSVNSDSATYRTPTLWNGLERLAGSLESLNIVRGIQLDPRELETFSKLRALEIGVAAVEDGQLASLDPSAWPELLSLRIDSAAVDGALWAGWAKRGALEKLRRLDAFQIFDVANIPDLEMARFWGTAPGPNLDLGNLQNAGKIRKLVLGGGRSKDLPGLTDLPFRDRIEALRFENGEITDLSPLPGFGNLAFLELFRCEQSPKEIDLGLFPELTHFYGSRLEQMETIDGVASHPALRSLMLMDCSALRTLGEVAPNGLLKYVYLYRCGALEDLSALDQASGLSQMRVFDCDLLAGPLSFLKKNSWNYLQVSGCEKIPDLSAMSLNR